MHGIEPEPNFEPPTAEAILRVADPSAQLDLLSAEQLLDEALQISFMAVREQARRWRRRNHLGRGADSQFAPEHLRLGQGLLEVVDDNGPWTKADAQYQPVAAQPELSCARCLLYQDRRCAIVQGDISPQATCRFIIAPALPPSRLDAHEPPKRIINWNGLRLGLSHFPGDLRHNRPMTAYYGHIRGTYGQAEDGMAVDVYLSAPDSAQDADPSALEELTPATVFRVKQIVPDTGELDECKFILGAADIRSAESLYLAHMPEEFFGGIDFATIDEIRPCKEGEENGRDRTSTASTAHLDAHLDARQTIYYQGLTLVLTHQPGDRRFSQFGKPLTSSYGFIQGSYGDGLDGKSIDVYVAPGFDPRVSRPVWRISQRNPDSGTQDEYKYMFGYPSLDAARDAYVFHAGRDRFGLIQRATTAELDPYRRSPLSSASALKSASSPRARAKRTAKSKRLNSANGAADDETPGGGNTAFRSQPARSRPAFNRDGWLGKTHLRQDSTDPDTLGEQMAQRLISALAPTARQWLQASRQWLVEQGSLESALRDLEQTPERLLKQMQISALGTEIYQAMVLADLAGREEVIDEGDPDEIRLDAQILNRIYRGIRQDANQDPVPPWLEQDFQEAVNYFLNKVNVPVDSYAGVTADYHDWAFSVAHMTQADWLQDAKGLLNGAITNGGQSFDDFVADWEDQISSQGWEPGVQGAQRLWTIYNTNVRGAMGAGRYAQMNNPAVLAQRNLWLWRWRDSPNPRLHHQALHMKAIPADDPFWRGLRVPAGWGCRCSIFAITEDYAQRNGIEILAQTPAPETIADPAFRTPYNAEAPYGGRDRTEFLAEKLQDYPPKLRAVLTERMNRTPPAPPLPTPTPTPAPTPTPKTTEPRIAVEATSLKPPPPPPPNSAALFMQQGAQEFEQPLARLDDAIASLAATGQAALPDVLKSLKEAITAKAGTETVRALSEEYLDVERAEKQQLLPFMQQIQETLKQQITRADASAQAAEVTLANVNRDERNVLSEWLTDVTQISGGKVDTLDSVFKNLRDDRAYASKNQRLISLGAPSFANEASGRATLFHEVGHHIEFSNPNYAEAARQWLQDKATSPVPEKLSTLTGFSQYAPSEVALPGDFLDPYVGKVYADGYTEVISMGLESFASPEAMLTLYRADREHFLFMLGILNDSTSLFSGIGGGFD